MCPPEVGNSCPLGARRYTSPLSIDKSGCSCGSEGGVVVRPCYWNLHTTSPFRRLMRQSAAYTGRKQAPTDGDGACRCWLFAHGSNPAENQQNDNHQKDESDSASWVIAPASTVGPARQCSQKRQNQDHDQYSSEHVCSLFLGRGKGATRKQAHARSLSG